MQGSTVFRSTKVLTVLVAAFLAVSVIVGLPHDCSARWPSPRPSDAVLVSLTGGRIVWLGPKGERNVVVALGEEPSRLVVSRDEERAYASVVGGVMAIDLKKNAAAGRVSLSGGHSDLAIAADGARLYAVHTVTAKPHEANYVVSVIDTAALKIVGQIPLEDMVVSDAVVTHDGAMLYVSHAYYSGRITVIDTVRQAIVGTINLPGQATAIGVTEDGRKLCVTQSLESKVIVIDTGTHETMGTFEVGDKPSDIAVAPGTLDLFTLHSTAYIANFGAESVSVIGGRDGRTVSVRKYPIRVAVPPSGAVAYVLHNEDREAGIIGNPVRYITLSGIPVGISRQPFVKDHHAASYRKAAYDSLISASSKRFVVWIVGTIVVVVLGAAVGRLSRTIPNPQRLMILVALMSSLVWSSAIRLVTPSTMPNLEYVYAAHRPLPATVWPVLAFAGGGTLFLTAALISWVISARKSCGTSTLADVDIRPRHRPE